MRTPSALLLACAVCGCALPEMKRTPEYELGYSEGCSDALAQTGALRDPRRNATLYANSEDYRRGWISGNAQCRPPNDGRF